MSEFGSAIRRARIDRGLSQADLGKPLFSRSYVSLVETGRRAPSNEVIEHFSQRLELPASVLRAWALAQGDSGTAQAALAQDAVLTAVTRSTRADADMAVSRLGEFALASDRIDLWWTAAILDIESHMEVGDTDSALAMAEGLLTHWFTQSSPALMARVLTVMSAAQRMLSCHEAAAASARSAVTCLDDHDEYLEGRMMALTALVSALAEGGHSDEAIALVPELRAAAEATPNGALAGKAYWSLGNLGFLSGDPAGGAADHDRAADLINPDRDLRNWGRIHRASAWMRLKVGAELDGVPGLLAKARAAFSISAGPADLASLALVEGSHALSLHNWEEAARQFTDAIAGGEYFTPARLVEAHQLLAQALQHLGDHAGAAEHYAAALSLLSNAGDDPPMDRTG